MEQREEESEDARIQFDAIMLAKNLHVVHGTRKQQF
jgi:hypothetical protein